MNRKTVIYQNIHDEELGKFSKVYGIKCVQEEQNCLLAMKYMDGISIQLTNRDLDDARQMSRILSPVGFCDMSFLPYLDSIIAIDLNGNIVLHDYTAQAEIGDFASNFNDEISPYKWTLLGKSNY